VIGEAYGNADLCEQFFSNMKYCKSKCRNRISDAFTRYSPYCSVKDGTKYYYDYATKAAVSQVTLQSCYRAKKKWQYILQT